MKVAKYNMSEVPSIPKNGLDVVSLFSGCGGSSLGYKFAGYDVKLALEFIPEAAEVYRLNHPGTIVLEKDIRDTTGSEILSLIGKRVGELDVLDGSPPCSAFSMTGLRDKGWGKVKKYSSTYQRVDDLFFEYIRLVDEIKPKAFVAENVKGFTLGNARDVLVVVLKELRSLGYRVDFKVLSAANYDVPQLRERVFIVGIREDLNYVPTFPKALGDSISVKEAIIDLIDTPSDKDIPETTERYRYIKKYFGALTSNLDIEKVEKEHNLSIYRSYYIRDKWDVPAYTLTKNSNRQVHPIRDRLLSVDEGKRLQSIPDDFILPSHHTPDQNWERIGRSVPPNLMYYLSKNLHSVLTGKKVGVYGELYSQLKGLSLFGDVKKLEKYIELK